MTTPSSVPAQGEAMLNQPNEIRELIEELCSAAVAYGERDTKDAENSYYAAKAHLIGAARALVAAPPCAAEPQASDDYCPTWVIVKRPGRYPDRKGPFHSIKLTEQMLRELYEHYPDAECIVIDMPHTSYPQDGREWIDMYGDRRRRRPPRPALPAAAAQGGQQPARPWNEPEWKEWVAEQARRDIFSEQSGEPRINVARLAWERAARFLSPRTDDDCTMSSAEANRLAATLREIAASLASPQAEPAPARLSDEWIDAIALKYPFVSVNREGRFTAVDKVALRALVREAAAPVPAPDRALMEQIAQQWDGCMYDAPGESIDIGEAIRSDWNRRATPPKASAPPAEAVEAKDAQREVVAITCFDDFTEASDHCLLSSEQDVRHQAKALVEFAIPALRWAEQRLTGSEVDDAARLDFLDATNRRFQMGWNVNIAPAGNVSVQTIIMGGQPIRAAIDAAIAATPQEPQQ